MVPGKQCSKGSVLEQLLDGTAWFEFVEATAFERFIRRFPSISVPVAGGWNTKAVSLCFANISGTLNRMQAREGVMPALRKTEYFTVCRIAGDGRCMFRALVQGMAANKGATLNYHEEEQEADELRLAVMDAICRTTEQMQKYEEALIAITVEESLRRYCERIQSSNFWGGESELLVLSRMCNQPVIVYIPEVEAKGNGCGDGYIPIVEYGSEFKNPGDGRKSRKPVRLLYSGSNHYDLLI